MKIKSIEKTKINLPNLKYEWEISRFISEKSADYNALNDLIKIIEERASVRTFGNAAVFLQKYFSKIVKRFENFTIAEKENLSIHVSSYAGTFPNAYMRKGSPQCTKILLNFKRGKWNVEKIYRGFVPKNEFEILNLPEKAREKAIKNFCNF